MARTDGRTPLDLTGRRTAGGILATTFELYFSYPGLFILPAALILVPYQLILLSINSSVFVARHGHLASGLVIVLLIDVIVVLPLVATFAIQAVVGVAERERPQLLDVVRHSLPIFIGVAAAQVVAGIVIFIGLVCFIVPGIYLAIRFAVIAQTAAFERTRWPTSISRAWELTRGHSLHVLATVFVTAILVIGLALIPSAIAASAGTAVSDTISVLINLFGQTFGVLMLAILYFDLRAREV